MIDGLHSVDHVTLECYGGPLDGTSVLVQAGVNVYRFPVNDELPATAGGDEAAPVSGLRFMTYQRSVIKPGRLVWAGYA